MGARRNRKNIVINLIEKRLPLNGVASFFFLVIAICISNDFQKKQTDYFEAKKNELNGKTFSDYQNVMSAKWEYFKAVYPHCMDDAICP